MAKNCFYKSYKGSLDIDSLYQLGSIGLKVTHQTVTNNNQQELALTLPNNSSVTITAKGNGFMADSIADLDDPAKRYTSKTFTRGSSDPFQVYSVFLKNDDYYIEISNKKGLGQLLINYNIADTTPSIIQVNLDSVGYCGFVTLQSNGNNTFGDISNLSTCSALKSLKLIGTNVYGNINSISNAWKELNINNSPDIYGEVGNITITSDATTLSIHHTGITGDILDFVAKQVSNGITSRTSPLNTPSILYQLSFNNKTYTTGVNTGSSLTWESASKIAVTVSNTVYCYGYTQQEAEAAFSGKTIVRVDAE